jgi:8-oxo-dGTP pyrophosphatase MutT (NUDIX family)
VAVGAARRLVDDGEDPAAAAAREVEEETGWRPASVEFVLSNSLQWSRTRFNLCV